MEKIAIKGHVTRGNDVIKILKSLEGINFHALIGNDLNLYYFIDDKNHINCCAEFGLPKEYKTFTLEKYEQKFLNNMEKRNIQIDLTTAKEWYKQGGDLRKVVLQAFTEKELQSLPKSWEEYCEINPYLNVDKETVMSIYGETQSLLSSNYKRKDYSGAIPSKERAEQFLILNKLLQIRDYYNQGCKLDWINDTEDKYVITTNKNGLCRCTSWFSNYIFAFKTRELRDEFFQNFKSDLEFIKEFL